ncbi:MAG: PDZ domain-containing protein [Acidimicrobiales bacterium]
MLLVIIVLQHWNTNEYALTPGDATPVAPLVKVEGLSTNAHPDRILLTDVYLSTVTAWQWIVLHFQSHVEFVPAADLVSPGIPTAELSAQGFLEMSDSQQAAEVAALRALGWRVPAIPDGAIVTAVAVPSPAWRAGVSVADRLVGVDGRRVTTSCGVVSAVHGFAPGTAVRLSVERSRISASGVITWSAPRNVSVTTATPHAQGPSACPGAAGRDHSWLGLSLEGGVNFVLPGAITINTANIGGPSAGLAMTLTLINKLSAGSLTGHRIVAATGTIDAAGQVGDVGGVAEKTVAVQRAGARVFLVPSVEVATARAAARPGLTIIGVTTLRGALRALRALGGATPVPLTRPH